VLLAAGGYDWHPDLPRYFEQLPEWRSMAQPSVSGDGLANLRGIVGGYV
jgi:hypothetical protein